MNAQEYRQLMTVLKQINPEDACRELRSTDEQIAARLSEAMGEPIAPQSDFVRLTRLALEIAASR